MSRIGQLTTAAAGLELPEPDAAALAHSERLQTLIHTEIAEHDGSLPFIRFMELVLYAPGLGYYSAGARKLGSAGDFVTAPEISPLFSRCLARQCGDILRQCDGQSGGSILELGAGSGIMAADIMQELAANHNLPEHYYILEVSADLRQRQQQTLQQQIPQWLDRIHWLDSLPDSGFRGVILANEVLDALPVQRFEITTDGPKPLHVTSAGPGFDWCYGDADAALSLFVTQLQQRFDQFFPVAYRSEYNPNLSAWLQALATALSQGVILLIDYGYPQREYYHPQRGDGALICHYRHRAHANPLILPGLQDISSSVDFSAVAQAGIAAGLDLAGYTSQNYFLFGCGLEQLLAEVDPADSQRYLELTRQVKLLTLPGEMGDRFKVIGFSQNFSERLRGFSFFDEQERL